jgi:uncharacterized protein (TIGR00730 family)
MVESEKQQVTAARQWGSQEGHPSVERFLEGPETRRFEVARLVRITWEFVRGFHALRLVGPCVTVFGSSRFGEDHRYYQLARQLGRRLAEAGFSVITGGGPGVMEAANRGAKDVGGQSIGCNIELPREQNPNPYVDRWIQFRYFFVRKVMLVKYSYAFVALPGGFGTMDEVFEIATLIQTRKIRDFPVVVMGEGFWKPVLDVMRQHFETEGTVDANDFDHILVTDSPDRALAHITQRVGDRFGFQWTRKPRPTRPMRREKVV